VHVHLGPVWYLERQEFDLKPGDEVRVKGMCEQQKDKDGKLRLIAYELHKGGFVLHLRDSQGRPNWEAWRKVGNSTRQWRSRWLRLLNLKQEGRGIMPRCFTLCLCLIFVFGLAHVSQAHFGVIQPSASMVMQGGQP
jgi:hypothetical protein